MVRYLVGTVVLVCVLAGCALGATAPTPVATPTVTATLTPLPPTASPTTTPTPQRTPQATTAPLARLVSVGNYKLYLECTGTGSPTVIMDSGLSVSSKAWNLVAPQISAFTRVCRYDRANLGKSEHAPTPRTSQDMVSDLRTLITNADIAGPYVLVGHSLGGLNMQLYMSEYHAGVAGMVLVDSAQYDEWERLRALLPAEQSNESPQLKEFRREFDDPIKGTERIDIKVSGEQVKVKQPFFGNLRLIVISHGKPIREIPAIASPFFEAIWADMQRDLLNLSTNSKQMIAEQSGHDIPSQQPQLVIDAIRQVVDAARR